VLFFAIVILDDSTLWAESGFVAGNEGLYLLGVILHSSVFIGWTLSRNALVMMASP